MIHEAEAKLLSIMRKMIELDLDLFEGSLRSHREIRVGDYLDDS